MRQQWCHPNGYFVLFGCFCRYGWRRWRSCTAQCAPRVNATSTALVPPKRYRPIVCLYNNVKVVSDSYCDDLLLPRPYDNIPCNTFSCDQYAFRLGEWSACTTTCGYGTKSRTVECIAPNGEYLPGGRGLGEGGGLLSNLSVTAHHQLGFAGSAVSDLSLCMDYTMNGIWNDATSAPHSVEECSDTSNCNLPCRVRRGALLLPCATLIVFTPIWTVRTKNDADRY